MIYLFGTGSFRGNEKIVKVGFTDDKEEREKAYLLHNPKGEFLGWRSGDKLMETKLHLRLKDFKQDFLDEWFYYEPEVEEIFGLPEHEIDKWLWENRNDIFFDPWLPETGSKKRKIYDELNSKYGENGSVLGDKAL